MSLLVIQKMSKQFGGLRAVNDVDLEIEAGDIFGLIGPNGAGKSTTLNMIDGSLRLTSGEIVFKGEQITKLDPYQRASKGIARVFQRDVLFGSFTVIENVMIGCHLHSRFGVKDSFLPWLPSTIRKEKELREKAMSYLELVGLTEVFNQMAVNLPHGSQRALGLAIAVATEAEMLLLDEPLTGMNGQETETMMALIKRLRKEEGKTVLIVEHNMKAVLGLCDKAVVLDYGTKIAEGLPQEVVGDPRVIEAYLGVDTDVAEH